MKLWYVVLAVVVGVVLAGCGGEQATPVGEGGRAAYTSEVLDTSYTGALDVGGQLALGTMLLEETERAVTTEQASALLPLWQALQSGVTAQAEANAVLKKIEEAMTPEQLETVAAMQLTHEDLRTWMQEQGLSGGPGSGAGGGDQGMPPGAPPGPPGEFPGGGEMPPEMVTRQAQFESMSEEERAALQATHEASGSPGEPRPGAPPPPDLLESLIELLSQRAAEGAGRPAGTNASRATSTPYPTPTPQPTSPPAPPISPTETTTPASTPATMPMIYIVQAGDSLSAIAREFGRPMEAIAEANNISDPDLIRVGQKLIIPSQSPIPAATVTPRVTVPPTSAEISAETPPTPVQAQPTSTSDATAATPVELTRIEDTDPGPPFTILVGSLRIEDGNYKVTGMVHNDGSETYEGIWVVGTFFEDDGTRHSSEAHCPCPFLESGRECPFSLEIYSRDYAEYHLHPEGQVIEYRQPAAIALSDLNSSNDGVGNVRITGVASNENAFIVENVYIAGALVDAGGQVVSVGSTMVLGEVTPGANAAFDLRIEYEPYSHYQLFAQATQD